MTAFALAAAGLAVVVVLVALRPFLWRAGKDTVSHDSANVAIYRDQLRELEADLEAGTLARADYERSRREIEARLLADVPEMEVVPAPRPQKFAGLAIALAVPLVAVAVYLATGTPRGLDASLASAPDAAQIEAMLGRLEAKLRENPDDAEGWKLLGRSYSVMGRFTEAVDAYAKAAQRQPKDPQLLADFADALAMAKGQKMAGEPERLVERALQIDPKNLKALALAGTAAFERQDYGKAAELWGRMLPLVPPDSEDTKAITENIDEAKKLAGIGAHPGVRGTVRLSPKLKDQVKAEDTVFIFARALEGPPMPLAALKVKASELPFSFALNDSLAMAPGMAVSAHSRVVVTARVAKSGAVKPAPGDLEGASKPVANDASGVAVVIDTVVR